MNVLNLIGQTSGAKSPSLSEPNVRAEALAHKTISLSRFRRGAMFWFLLIVSFPARATTYYVAAAGSDSNSGTSTGHPWQTIAHVNAQTFARAIRFYLTGATRGTGLR